MLFEAHISLRGESMNKYKTYLSVDNQFVLICVIENKFIVILRENLLRSKYSLGERTTSKIKNFRGYFLISYERKKWRKGKINRQRINEIKRNNWDTEKVRERYAHYNN